MTNKRVGIFTHYYRSLNYGGLLQAYALLRQISDMGYDAEVVCYDYKYTTRKMRSHGVIAYLKRIKRSLLWVKHLKTNQELVKRQFALYRFGEEYIKHSELVFTDDTIFECVDLFDIFVTGSDQVWNPDWYREPFMLSFVPKDKKKLSYAASMGKSKLSAEQGALYKEKLSDFDALSVREEEAAIPLKEVLGREVEWVLDPTMLIEKGHWEEMCTPRQIKKRYLLCYFLGDGTDERIIAKQYAKKNGLKIVTLPYLGGSLRDCDKRFGHLKLFGIMPFELLSLIRYSECVFTDSFHATVFSSVFQKDYFVFERNRAEEMSTRIRSLTILLNSEDRFCNTQERKKLSYIESLDSIDYSFENERLMKMKRHSIEFLRFALQT